MEQVIGRIEKVYFSDESTDFYIFGARNPSGSGRPFKVKGHFFNIRVLQGVEFLAKGMWEHHPKYGASFTAEESHPHFGTQQGKDNYILSILKSCGHKEAYQIFKHLGSDAIEKIHDKPELLLDIPDINQTLKTALHSEWQMAMNYGNVAQELLSLGIQANQIKNIYTLLGEDAIEMIKDNPYLLALVEGIQFSVADSIALKMGFAPDSSYRIASILEYLLEISARSRGHLYLKKSNLLEYLNRLPSKENVYPYGRPLTTQDLEEALEDRIEKCRVVVDNDCVYLKDNHYREVECASKLSEILSTNTLGMDVKKFITDYERIHHITFSLEQAEALRKLNESKVLLLTGHPGTGKTLTTKAMVTLLHKAEKTFQLLSPTGIAAKRLESVTGHKASTIHRALKYKGFGEWEHNSTNKLATQAVIVDEVSMIDQHVFYRLLDALPHDVILILVGDPAQLPSVGAGNVLHELIRSNCIPRVHLNKIFRQESASDIVINAHNINSGEPLELNDPADPNTDFKVFTQDSDTQIQRSIVALTKKLFSLPDPPSFQVLSPRYKGKLGVNALNEIIKETLNPPSQNKVEVTLGMKKFREEDRIMVIENNYNLDVYNGEVGKIYFIDKKKQIIRVKLFDEFDSRIVDIDFATSKDMLILSYAVTIHKCLHPDTWVETEKGVQRIRDISDTGFIATPDGMKPYHNKVTNIQQDTVKFQTVAHGFNFEATPEHLFEVFQANSFKPVPASMIQKGEWIMFSKGFAQDTGIIPNIPSYQDNTDLLLTEDMAEFLGAYQLYLVYSSFDSRFCDIRPSTYVILKKGLDRFFNIDINDYEVTPHGLLKFSIDDESFKAWTKDIGFNEKEIIPNLIGQSSLSLQKAFVRGIFSGLDFQSVNETVSIPFKARKPASDLQYMLLRLGVLSEVVIMSNSSIALDIRSHHVLEFDSIIGFNDDVKKKLTSSFDRDITELVPINEQQLNEILDIFPHLLRDQNNQLTRISADAIKDSVFPKNLLTFMQKELAKSGISIPWINFVLDKSLVFDRIKKIEQSKSITTCVNVPEGNKFLQNGIHGWNCQGQEFDAVIFPFHNQFSMQLQRNLLYTAVTRAKKKVYTFGQITAFDRAIRNNEVANRNTNFAKRLVENTTKHQKV